MTDTDKKATETKPASRTIDPDDGPKVFERCLRRVQKLDTHWQAFVVECLAAYVRASSEGEFQPGPSEGGRTIPQRSSQSITDADLDPPAGQPAQQPEMLDVQKAAGKPQHPAKELFK